MVDDPPVSLTTLRIPPDPAVLGKNAESVRPQRATEPPRPARGTRARSPAVLWFKKDAPVRQVGTGRPEAVAASQQPSRARGHVCSALFFFPRGGSAQVTRALARALPETGWRMTLATGSL